MYNESITYDKNGNIITLNRNGVYDDPIYELEMDNLSYFYSATNPNQLVKVNDSTNNPNGFKDGTNTDDDYTYDANGNMLTDKNKGITSNIKYNHLNLPVTIDFGENGNIMYIYNALGQKVRKDVSQGELHIMTDYLNGFQYEDTRLEFFPTAEGYVKYTRIESAEHFNYVYNYTDHLGNIRLSYGLDQDNVLKILEENNYYPFGLKHENYNLGRKEFDKYGIYPIVELQDCVNCSYKYKYNGKEYQDELGLNFYDYGARNYDPALGRWMNIDPLAENSRRFSPYTYALNNPVYFIDPDGMWVNIGGTRIINAVYNGLQNMTTTYVGNGYSKYNRNDIGRNRDREIFPGMKVKEHTHLLPSSGVNSKGSSSVLSENYSGPEYFGSVTTSVSLTNTCISGVYYNSKGEKVSSISEASSYVVTKSTETLTVAVFPSGNGVSDTVDVKSSNSVTTYIITDNSGMDLFGGKQLTDPKTVTNTANSTMALSAAPESLQQAAGLKSVWNGANLPSPASDHIDNTVERTIQQEQSYNENEINNEHRKYR